MTTSMALLFDHISYFISHCEVLVMVSHGPFGELDRSHAFVNSCDN